MSDFWIPRPLYIELRLQRELKLHFSARYLKSLKKVPKMEPKYLPKGGQWHLEASKATSNEDEENTLGKRDQ